MSAIQFHCPLCTGLFQVDDALAGVELNCPHCAGVVTVPNFDVRGFEVPAAGVEALELNCPVCTGPFQVSSDMSGQQVACPHCQQVIAVPEFAPEYAPPLPNAHAPPAQPPAAASSATGFNRPLPLPRQADNLLPPAATSEPVTAPRNRGAQLPPASGDQAVKTSRVPLPATIPTRSKDTVLIPTAQGYVGVHEPTKTVRYRGEEVELRQLTPKEKGRRRLIRNTVLFVFCLVLLIVVMVALQ